MKAVHRRAHRLFWLLVGPLLVAAVVLIVSARGADVAEQRFPHVGEDEVFE